MLKLCAIRLFAWFMMVLPIAAQALKPPDTAPINQAILDNFDGRTFAVSFGQDGKGEAGKDVIRFENGKMSTELCKKFGFVPAPYLLRVENGKVFFHASMVSETQGVNVFSGHIEGDSLVAHADWEQPRWYWTIHVASWFEGKQADPKADLPVFLN
jgi:hypothetical protein